MAIPSELLASPGDSIRQKYTQLLAWIDAQKMFSQDDRVTTNQTPNGQFVVMNQRPPSIVTPLQVAQSGKDGFVVREGYVNGRLPLIANKQGQEEPLVDPDGQPHKPAKLPTKRPLLVCAEVVFNKEFTLESCKIVTKEPKEIPRTGSANLAIKADKMTGLIPLAFIRKTTFFQFVTHNIQVRAFENAEIKTIIYFPA